MIREIVFSKFTEEKPVVRDWIDSNGREVLDKTPVAIPIQASPPPSSLMELIHQLYRDMDPKNYESMADADDFDVPDELGIEMMDTPYEQDFDHVETPPEPAPQPAPVLEDPS